MGSTRMKVLLSLAAILAAVAAVGFWIAGMEAKDPLVAAAVERAEEDAMWARGFLFYALVAAGGSVLLAGLWKFARARGRNGGSGMAAVVALGLLMGFAIEPALAQDIGDMAEKSAAALESFPLVIQILFYVVGLAVLGMGLYKLIQNRQTPGGGSVWGSVLWMSVGAIMIAIPQGLDIILGTFGIGTGGGTIQRPKL